MIHWRTQNRLRPASHILSWILIAVQQSLHRPSQLQMSTSQIVTCDSLYLCLRPNLNLSAEILLLSVSGLNLASVAYTCALEAVLTCVLDMSLSD